MPATHGGSRGALSHHHHQTSVPGGERANQHRDAVGVNGTVVIYRRGLLPDQFHQNWQKETKYDAAAFTIPPAALSGSGFIRARRYVLFSVVTNLKMKYRN